MAVLIEGYRRMSPQKKLERVFSMTRTLKILIEAQVRKDYPDASDAEVRLRVGSRWIPRELMIKAYGWDPEAPENR